MYVWGEESEESKKDMINLYTVFRLWGLMSYLSDVVEDSEQNAARALSVACDMAGMWGFTRRQALEALEWCPIWVDRGFSGEERKRHHRPEPGGKP